MADGASRLAVAAHPVAVGALVVLVVNDHVLKGWSGGIDGLAGTVARTATGKASDVAGVLLLAVWIGVLVGRRRPAVVAVALGFTALKLSPAVAEAAVPLLGGRTRTDPWDLLALVALVPADRILRPVDALPRWDLRPVSASLRPTLGLALLLVSVPAMTATSCGKSQDDEGPERSEVLAARDDGSLVRFVAEGDRGDHDDETTTTTSTTTTPSSSPSVAEPPTWWISTDDGETWREEPRPPAEARRLQREWRQTDACTADACYRLAREAAVIEEGGSEARTELFSASDRAAMKANEDGCDGLGEHDATAVEIVATDDVAVVSVPPYGLVRNDGDGWEHVDTAWGRRASDLPRAWPRYLAYTPYLGVVALGLVLWWSVARSPRRSWLRPFSVFLAVLGSILGAGVLVVGTLGYPSTRTQGLRIGAMTAIVLAVALLPLLRLLIWPQHPDPPAAAPGGPVPPGAPAGAPGRPPGEAPPSRPGPPPRYPGDPGPPPPPPSGWI